MASDSSADFPSTAQEGARAGTDARGCVETVPAAPCVFIIDSIFPSEIGSTDLG